MIVPGRQYPKNGTCLAGGAALVVNKHVQNLAVDPPPGLPAPSPALSYSRDREPPGTATCM
jgi:hypothetical protein